VRVLITGAAGQLGRALVDAFDGDDVIATTRAELDLADRDSVMGAICSTEPDVVVHAGAWTAVDACEADPERAFVVNALGSRHVAAAARIEEPYHEWSMPNPRSVYGASKLGAELEVQRGCPDATIVRTSWVVSADGRNFLTTMLRLAQERDEIGVVDDQRGCPTFTTDLAPIVRRLSVGRFAGVFHACNQGATSWFEFARAILSAVGDDPEKIRPISTSAYGAAAPRPANSVLDNLALRASGLPVLPHWRATLERVATDLVKKGRAA
jgi:dTDP-4-dehydrorhamnose reductase